MATPCKKEDRPTGLMDAGQHDRPARSWYSSLLSAIIILMVFIYRSTLGLVLVGRCRYSPTCSQYMIDAVRAHGPMVGAWHGLKRIARCHPWGGCGYDPV